MDTAATAISAADLTTSTACAVEQSTAFVFSVVRSAPVTVVRNRVLGIKEVPLTAIRGFSGGNPKNRTAVDRELLHASLENHGYVLPMAVRDLKDGTFELIDGHGRLDEIQKMDPGIKLKVVVVDVASVAEGRRILLALQHTAGWDVDALERFVRDGLAEGTDMAALMADTGLTGKQLDAFAAEGARELERMAVGAGESDGPAERDGEPRSPSRAGQATEHVQFAVPITREQSKQISAAVRMAKTIHGLEVKGDALAKICEFYVEQQRELKKQRKTSKD